MSRLSSGARSLAAGLALFVNGCDGDDADDSNDRPDLETQAWRTSGHTIDEIEVEGHELDDRSQHGALSAGGRYLTFSSLGSNVVENDVNGISDVFIRDLEHGHDVELISVNLEGMAGNGESFGASASTNG